MKTNFFIKICILSLVAAGVIAATPQAQARDNWSMRGSSYHHDHHHGHRPSYRAPRYRSVEASVQYELARRGYYRGPIDGLMGAVATRAVRNFQRDRGLAVTGNINKDVLRSLGLL